MSHVHMHTGERRLVQRNRRLHENRRCVFYRSKYFLQMKAGSCSVNAVHEHWGTDQCVAVEYNDFVTEVFLRWWDGSKGLVWCWPVAPFRPSQPVTPWPSLCTALCSTGSSSTSTTPCSTNETWRSPSPWVLLWPGQNPASLNVRGQIGSWCLSVLVCWCPGHVWLRESAQKRFWAAVHQLR